MVKLTKTPKSNLQYQGPRTSSNRYWVLGTVNLYCKFEKQELSNVFNHDTEKSSPDTEKWPNFSVS
jgi:hypothetical protein